MSEVEISSEFAQLMMKGIVGKTQKAIDHLYKDNEDVWAERTEVERRFRHCMDELENSVGADLGDSAFTKRAAFHALYCALYDAAFGLGSSLKRKKAEPLPTAFKTRLLKTSDAIRCSSGAFCDPWEGAP